MLKFEDFSDTTIKEIKSNKTIIHKDDGTYGLFFFGILQKPNMINELETFIKSDGEISEISSGRRYDIYNINVLTINKDLLIKVLKKTTKKLVIRILYPHLNAILFPLILEHVDQIYHIYVNDYSTYLSLKEVTKKNQRNLRYITLFHTFHKYDNTNPILEHIKHCYLLEEIKMLFPGKRNNSLYLLKIQEINKSIKTERERVRKSIITFLCIRLDNFKIIPKDIWRNIAKYMYYNWWW